MRWPSAWLTACSCLLVVAGCGGSDGPRLPAGYARPAAAQSERIAELLEAGRSCAAAAQAARLQATTIRAINAGRIPPALQEELLGRITGLAGGIPCGEPGPPGANPAAEARALSEWIQGLADI